MNQRIVLSRIATLGSVQFVNESCDLWTESTGSLKRYILKEWFDHEVHMKHRYLKNIQYKRKIIIIKKKVLFDT